MSQPTIIAMLLLSIRNCFWQDVHCQDGKVRTIWATETTYWAAPNHQRLELEDWSFSLECRDFITKRMLLFNMKHQELQLWHVYWTKTIRGCVFTWISCDHNMQKTKQDGLQLEQDRLGTLILKQGTPQIIWNGNLYIRIIFSQHMKTHFATGK